jgi:glutathione S-transferase
LNPQRTVPVVDNDGFVMNESRAIIAYLADTKNPGGTLYPSDPKTRFIIDHRLFYDATTFSQRIVDDLVKFHSKIQFDNKFMLFFELGSRDA